MKADKKNYYRLLQVDASADVEVIEAAYRKLAKKYHPDANESLESQHRMQRINEAYTVLRDPKKRAQYDWDQLNDLKGAQNDFGESYPAALGGGSINPQDDFSISSAPSVPSQSNFTSTHTDLIARWVLNGAVILLVVLLFGIVIWMARERFFPSKTIPNQQISAQINPSSPSKEMPVLPLDAGEQLSTNAPLTPFLAPQIGTSLGSGAGAAISSIEQGITRLAMLHTTIPTRPRTNVINYAVAKGDNLFLIGEKFGIKPETVLWGNYDALNDNPRMLKIGQQLNILPTDGVYYKWKEGDSLRKVAQELKTDPQNILDYAGNRFDLTKSSIDDPGINKDTWIIVPGGKRPIKDWGPPAISRTNPAVASYYGEGSCGKVYTGAVGNGSFVWPVPASHMVSGYDFTEIHKAIDIGGQIGAAVVASDSGVVVYAGWSNYGYGNLLVIDHGNGWQTGYAHLNAVGAACGQSVMAGGTVATLGNSGNSTGPHLHFEMKLNGAGVNPHDFLGE